MAGEIQLAYVETGADLYALVRNSIGEIWNTDDTAFESYDTNNITDYAIALTEQGTASTYYVGDMPAVGDGIFSVVVYKQAGANPAEGDSPVGNGDIQFRGSAVPSFDDILDDTEDIQLRLPTSLVSGRIDASVGAMQSNVITAAATAADYLAEINAEVDTALADYDAPTHAELVSEIDSVQSDIAALNDITAADVWASGTRTLTSLGTGVIVAATFGTGAITADALASDAANEIADATLDRSNGIETGYTLRQAQRIILSAVAGESSGHTSGASSPVYRDVNDTKNRITASCDADGNRTSVTLDAT